MTASSYRPGTRAVHAGMSRDFPDFHPSGVPLYPSSSFYYDDPETLDEVLGGERKGYVYSRYANPTTTALEEAVAALEEAETAVAYGSGMAALHAALLAAGASTGRTVVAAQDLYGATRSLLTTVLGGQGVRTVYVDATDASAVRSTLAQHTPVVLIVETMSNPLLKVADIAVLADLAHQRGAVLIVDNTFASPALCQPLRLGADYVVHSMTKYLSGHGDSTGGAVACSAARRADLEHVLRLVGGVLSPFEAWLTLRGIRTLHLRMRQHWHNAGVLATWLVEQPQVTCVHFPGLSGHPQHDLATRLFGEGRYGAVIAFELRGAGKSKVFDWMRALKIVLPATTLGDVASEVLYPAMSSHRAMLPEQRQAIGISDGLIRLAVGIEDVEDIKADLCRAFLAVS